MPTRLIALNGGPDITVIGHAPMTMGRDPRCDARLDSSRVSRFHCCLAQIDDGVQVSDLGSTNGTRINGRCIKSGRLLPGDELMVAYFRYRVEGDRPRLEDSDNNESRSPELSKTSQMSAQEGYRSC